MDNKKENKKLPVYEIVFDENKKNGIISINLTKKPLFGKFIKIVE